MKNSFIDRQVNEIQQNFNYFLMRMIVKVMIICFKLSLMLLINEIFNYTIINILSIIYSFYAIYNMYYTVNYYKKIMNDIKNTINDIDIYYELDFSLLKKGVVNYGK